MTEEQEEAIESLEQLINIRKNKAGKIKYDNCICSTTDIERVLNMLKEKDAKIEKKDKMIDLMAEELKKHIFVLYDGDTITSKKGIIEHYERKATNDG